MLFFCTYTINAVVSTSPLDILMFSIDCFFLSISEIHKVSINQENT
jgi:hypothetical protein